MNMDSMLFFDLDGTLIDSNGVWKEVDGHSLARPGAPLYPRLL